MDNNIISWRTISLLGLQKEKRNKMNELNTTRTACVKEVNTLFGYIIGLKECEYVENKSMLIDLLENSVDKLDARIAELEKEIAKNI